MRGCVALTIIWTVWLLYGASLPGGPLEVVFPLGALVTIGLTIAVAVVNGIALLARGPGAASTQRRKLPLLGVLVPALIIIALAFISNWPLIVRFELSRAAFDAEVARIQKELENLPPATQPLDVPYGRGGKWIGLFGVEHITVVRHEGQLRFYFRTGLAFVGSSGFLYCEDTPKRHARHGILRPPWYPYARD